MCGSDFKFIKNDGGFEDKSVKKEDIRFLFVCYVEEAWEADRIAPVEEALVGAWRQVDTHFGYAQVEKNRIESDDGEGGQWEDVEDLCADGDDIGGIKELQYGSNMLDID